MNQLDCFINRLIRLAGIKRVLFIGYPKVDFSADLNEFQFVQLNDSSLDNPGQPYDSTSPQKKIPQENLRIIEVDLQNNFSIPQELLEDSIVICNDVFDHLQNPHFLIKALANARQHCAYMLITCPDRNRVEGFRQGFSAVATSGSSSWSGEEFFQQLVANGFPYNIFFGHVSDLSSSSYKSIALAIAGREVEPVAISRRFKSAAIVNVFNEADVIEDVVRYLASQDIETHLIDNWSDDGSYEICQKLVGQGLAKYCKRFPDVKSDEYQWAAQLEHSARYAQSLDSEWVIHYDADEIRCSPWPDLSLNQAVQFVDSLGYNAIDFTVIDFRFTDDDESDSPTKNLQYFEFPCHQANFVQIKAWKNTHQLVDLKTHGGHEVLFDGRKVYPLKFLTKHYSLRSKRQAEDKIYRRRIPRIHKEREELGWHVHFDLYRLIDAIEPWSKDELVFYKETYFQDEFLVERLSGCGLERHEFQILNRANLSRLISLTMKLYSEDQFLYAKRITGLEQQNASLVEQMRVLELQRASLELEKVSTDQQKAAIEQQKAGFEQRLSEVLSSTSWKVTRPLRYVSRGLSRINISKFLYLVTFLIWRKLPSFFGYKQKFKRFGYRVFLGISGRKDNAVSLLIDKAIVAGDRYLALQESGDIDHYVPLLRPSTPVRSRQVKLLSFYLPQFHAIPENDDWWGKGFTEWSNVQPAQPQFAGHYQPHVPGELGFYNLLDRDVQRRQVELAKLYGIEGFCFYFYWFGGRRLLETPVENYLADDSLDLPFCLCWANENWSRRWDGLDSEILIAQEHSAEDDIAFIQHIAKYILDSRYIRINGRPLLLVYRPSLLPSALQTAQRWREWCNANGIGEIYLAYTQAFERTDPKEYGFDAAIEFPPNNSAPPDITHTVTPLTQDFSGKVYDWRIFVERSEQYTQPGYKLFRSVCPSWDNTARRKKAGTIFCNSSPALYESWLKNAIADTVAHQANPEERLIFINAWNEWAEGAYLEPDARYGYAWLQATRNALTGEGFIPDNRRRIILVTHDAYPHGAQMLAANMAKTLSRGLGFDVDTVCLGDGPLKQEYARWSRLHDLSGQGPCGAEATRLARKLYELGHRQAIVNTTVSGYFLKTLTEAGIECIALIHELRGVLEQYKLQGQAQAIAEYAAKVVFPAREVADAFSQFSPVAENKVIIRPQGLYKRCEKSRNTDAVRTALRRSLGLTEDSFVVLGAGYADHRKGIDIFVKAGLLMATRVPQARWVWIGHWERNMQNEVDKLLAAHPDRRDVFIFPGLQAETDMFYRGADIFALTSREDPFPSVVLEALDAEIPVVGFEGAGGFNTLLKEGCGAVVAKEDAKAFADTVADLLEQPEARLEIGRKGIALINQRFSFRHYLYDLLDNLGIGLARVSVVVPNYNYANFLPERLESIIGQDYPIYEIIFLDDCSRDESLQVAERLLSQSGIDYQIIVNKKNSGSVFRQWRKGVELARGTHLWIAEADDSCEAGLISELVKGFGTPGVVLSYCESKQMDENNTLLAENYRYYVDDVDAKHWLTAYVMDGEREITEYLSVKNTIPNVSGVLFSKDALQSVMEKHFDDIAAYHVAGDWMAYVLVLAKGKVSFSPASMNKHRRHSGGVTISGINRSQLEEIQKMQQYIAAHYPVKDEVIANARRYIDALSEEHGIEM